jgi:large subunit ribosomal protein L30
MSETGKSDKKKEEKKISAKVNAPAPAVPAEPNEPGEANAAPVLSSPSKKSSAAALAAVQKPPAAAKAAAPKASGALRIRQVKSGICAPVDQKQTLFGLGLRRIRHEVVRPDTPTVRGQVHKVRHLVEIVEGGVAR